MSEPPGTWRTARTVLAVVLLVLVVIVVLQNTETVRTDILFVELAMPRALLLIVTFALGTLVGLLLGMRRARLSSRQPKT